MRSIRLFALSTAAAFTAATFAPASEAQAAPQDFVIDGSHSHIVFLVDHLGYSKNVGRFQEFSGEFTMDEDAPENSSVSVTIQSTSVFTDHAERDEHLRSPDFLNAQEFPTITFESTGVEVTGENTAEVTGDFTMMGQTHPVMLDVTFNRVAPHPLPQYDGVLTAGFSARGSLQRSQWGMDTFVPAIGDDIDLIIEIEGADAAAAE